MSGIIMCSSEKCPMKNECYRGIKKQEHSQGWYNFEYTCNENTEFENFIKNDSEKAL